MREYILNIDFETWQNQLWFINLDDSETEEKWQKAIKEIDSLKDSYKDAIKFQTEVIDYLKDLGFIRIQK